MGQENRFKVVLLDILPQPCCMCCENEYRTSAKYYGDSNVGKSTMLLQFTENQSSPSPSTTIGIDYKKSTMVIENQTIVLDIWDTAGQERYRALTRNHFRNAQGVVLMYSVNNEQSYRSITNWQTDIERYCPPQTRVLIIGNKCDLPTRAIPVEQGLLVSSRLGAPFMETSAKENVNVKTTFHLLAKMMLDERKASVQSRNMEQLLKEKLIRLDKCDCCQRAVENTYSRCCNIS